MLKGFKEKEESEKPEKSWEKGIGSVSALRQRGVHLSDIDYSATGAVHNST
jgi:hypothetical protein